MADADTEAHMSDEMAVSRCGFCGVLVRYDPLTDCRNARDNAPHDCADDLRAERDQYKSDWGILMSAIGPHSTMDRALKAIYKMRDATRLERERCAAIAAQYVHICPGKGSCFGMHDSEQILKRILKEIGNGRKQ